MNGLDWAHWALGATVAALSIVVGFQGWLLTAQRQAIALQSKALGEMLCSARTLTQVNEDLREFIRESSEGDA